MSEAGSRLIWRKEWGALGPCEGALTVPVSYDTQLLCLYDITHGGSSLVEFDSWVSHSLDFHSQIRTRYRGWRVLQRCLGMHRAVYPGISLYIELKVWFFGCCFGWSPRHRVSALQTFKFNPIIILSLQIARSSFISQVRTPLKFSLVQSICV